MMSIFETLSAGLVSPPAFAPETNSSSKRESFSHGFLCCLWGGAGSDMLADSSLEAAPSSLFVGALTRFVIVAVFEICEPQ